MADPNLIDAITGPCPCCTGLDHDRGDLDLCDWCANARAGCGCPDDEEADDDDK